MDKHEEYQYLNLLENVIEYGHKRQTRNAIVYSMFGSQLQFDLKDWTLPLLTTKRVSLRFIFEELMFFLRGQTNSKILQDKGIHIWDDNTSREFLDQNGFQHYSDNSMGNMYGFQWLHYGCDYEGSDAIYKGYNQLEETIKLLKKDIYSRRMIMTTFDPSRAKQGVLYPCHSIVLQWYIEGDNRLSVHNYIRSSDLGCGLSFNIGSTSLMCMLMCQTLNSDPEFKNKLEPGRVIISLGDYHLYEDHIDAVKEQLKRVPYSFPTLKINKLSNNITDYEWEDLQLINYQCHPTIKMKMVV